MTSLEVPVRGHCIDRKCWRVDLPERAHAHIDLLVNGARTPHCVWAGKWIGRSRVEISEVCVEVHKPGDALRIARAYGPKLGSAIGMPHEHWANDLRRVHNRENVVA